MKSSDYWRQRFEAIEEQAHEKASEYIKNADSQYRRAMQSLRQDINDWYARFAENNGISMTDARKLLSSKELEEFKWTVEDYIRHGEQLHLHPEWRKQLENASARFHISRLEALRLQVRQQAELLHGNQAESMEKHLRDILSDGYDHTLFEIQRGTGVGWNAFTLDKRKIDRLLDQPWTTDERTFRDRCWTNKTELVNTVNNVMTQGIIRGDSPQKMITAITDRFDVARSKAARLVYTESSYFSARAQAECYDDLNVEDVKVLETLDSRTCASCGSMDGTVVSRKDYEPGVTVPPFHPGCRGTTCPYFDDMEDGQRIARNAEGKTYHVPADTTFEQWKEVQESGGKPVANGGNSGIIKAANAPRNTGKLVKYNPDADFSITLPDYPEEINKALSDASAEVAHLGGKDGMEHLCLVDLKTGKTVLRESGDQDSVGGKAFWDYVINNPKQKLAFVHNHLKDTYFSERDMTTLLGSSQSVDMFIASRLDGVRYVAEKIKTPEDMFFDHLYEKEMDEINLKLRSGEITPGERTRMREEMLVDNLLRDYTKGLIEFE